MNNHINHYSVNLDKANQQLVEVLLYARYSKTLAAESFNERNDLKFQLEKSIQTGDKLEDDFPIDIVYGGAYSIKKYYMESGNPRQMRGASQLLNEIFKKHVPIYLKDNYKADCSYYEGGSQVFIIMPAGEGDKLALYIEECFQEVCPTASGAAIYRTFFASDLLSPDKFSNVKGQLFKDFNSRRMLKFDVYMKPSVKDSDFKIADHPYIESYQGKEPRCSRCRLRTPVYIAKPESADSFVLCSSCARKEDAGDYNARYKFKKCCKDYADRDKQLSPYSLDIEDDIRSTDDLQDSQGNIALLYADINNLGGVGSKVRGIQNYKCFYSAVDETVKKALFRALILSMKKFSINNGNFGIEKNNELKARFEIIAVGGDDICVLLPGQAALFAGTTLMQEFETIWRNEFQSYFETDLGQDAHLSISVGVSVAQSNTPLTSMQTTTEQLLDSAKGLSHRLNKEQNEFQGAIDILSLNGDRQWAADLDFLRNYEDVRNPLYKSRAQMTMRPFSVVEADKFLDILAIAREFSNNMLRNIDSACKECGIEEGNLFFQDMQARIRNDENLKKENLTMLLASIREMLECRSVVKADAGMYFELDTDKENSWISPWHDIMDLYDQMGGTYEK